MGILVAMSLTIIIHIIHINIEKSNGVLQGVSITEQGVDGMELLRKSFDNGVATNYKRRSSDAWGGGACILSPDGKILLGLRTGKSEEWCTPGGKIDLGETAMDGLHREVKEEANLDLNKANFKLVDIHIGAFKNEKVWLSFVYYYQLTEAEYKKSLKDLYPQKGEIEEWKWVSPEDIGDYNLFPPTKMSFELLKKHNVL